MKRSDLFEANALSAKLSEIETSIEFVEDAEHHPNYLGITLQGFYQDANFINACRETVLRELKSRKNDLVHSLIGLGVYEN